ncbi:SDR family oxidoreductase [Microbacterium lacticum]
MPSLDGAVVLITGANGGLGTQFVAQALQRGASKVYAAARHPREWGDKCIVPLTLDVTSPESIAAAAEIAADVSVLVNNAGASNHSSVLGDLAPVRELFEVNFWGPLAVTNAFTPALTAAKGTLLNVLSVLSWLGIVDAYSVSKAALWQATNVERLKLAPSGIHVASLHLGRADTPMTRHIDEPKLDPADVVRSAYDGLEAGSYEILADELSAQVKAGLAGPIEALYPELARSRG